jgi:hypothetical protein
MPFFISRQSKDFWSFMLFFLAQAFTPAVRSDHLDSIFPFRPLQGAAPEGAQKEKGLLLSPSIPQA